MNPRLTTAVRSPAPLRQGDAVALIATSGAVAPDRIEPSVKAIERMGYRVETGASVRQKLRYLAGGDEVRANDINTMFAREDIRGIFVIRGGYGAGRLLDLLDFEMIGRNPKFFAGYSDVTALHSVFGKFVTFHSPMAASELYRGVDSYTEASLRRAAGGLFRGEVINPPGEDIRTLRAGRCRGALTGGNLTAIASGLGTAYEIDARGKILLLEEINEPPYSIDRLLTQLRQSGKLSDAVGFALGAFTGCGGESELLEIWLDRLPEGKPAIYNLAAGHRLPAMTLALNAAYAMDAGKGLLICEG